MTITLEGWKREKSRICCDRYNFSLRSCKIFSQLWVVITDWPFHHSFRTVMGQRSALCHYQNFIQPKKTSKSFIQLEMNWSSVSISKVLMFPISSHCVSICFTYIYGCINWAFEICSCCNISNFISQAGSKKTCVNHETWSVNRWFFQQLNEHFKVLDVLEVFKLTWFWLQMTVMW